MGDFIALCWRPEAHPAADHQALKHCRSGLVEAGWMCGHEQPGLWILTRGRRAPTVRQLWADGRPAGVLIGDVFDRHGTPLPTRVELAPQAPADMAASLVATVWGAYVAVMPGAAAELGAILRDPMGGLDCATWRADGVFVAASTPAEAVLALRGGPFAIDWPVVAGMVCDTARIPAAIALQGVQTVAPGCLVTWTAQGPAQRRLWRGPTSPCGRAPSRGLRMRRLWLR